MTVKSLEMKIYLPEKKVQGIVQKCQTILSAEKCSIHNLAILIGMLVATASRIGVKVSYKGNVKHKRHINGQRNGIIAREPHG